ncbi:hypothetical protein AM1_D0097 (plasmid) [Acaryochloris marina MBIC11017]|uniref:Uncharacterized protein n=1 Tax=Acaryochloris marina (strain MBIC 11017) TaxID=329726 RepID=A8ZNK6_ACAM1|nr:hypothetical protein AM1_D0097 [Acaryochloris marina MBIC11017]
MVSDVISNLDKAEWVDIQKLRETQKSSNAKHRVANIQ